MEKDIRDTIFESIEYQIFTARLCVERDGIISGIDRLRKFLEMHRISSKFCKNDGESVSEKECILTVTGTPKQIAVSEEFIAGALSKPSGIATAAHEAVRRAGRIRIVSGAWKKMPYEIKSIVREAVLHGGAHFRIADVPFLYLDKNFVSMFGGIRQTLTTVADRSEMKCIQVKGYTGSIVDEAVDAVQYGADIIMVDTGNIQDVREISLQLKSKGLRRKVQIAFAKGIKISEIEQMQGEDIDIMDIGTQIIDAPILDMRLDVVRK